METVQRTFSGAPWEKKLGYCRAIRMGNIIAVTGTIPSTKAAKSTPPATRTRRPSAASRSSSARSGLSA